MKYLTALLCFIFSVTVFNLATTRSSVSEAFGCEKLSYYINMAETRHVSKLFPEVHEDRFNKSLLLSRSYVEMAKTLDPYKLFFLEEDINNFKSFEPFSQNEISYPACQNYFNIKTEFISAQGRLNSVFVFPQNKDEKWLLLQELNLLNRHQKESSKFKVEGWAKDMSQLSLRVRHYLLNTYNSFLPHSEKQIDALEATLRAFKRDIESLTARNESLEETILKAITASLDAHSEFYSVSEFNEVSRGLSSSFVGVGIIVTEVWRGYKILELIDGGPAANQKALKKGDVITHADGVTLAGLSVTEITPHLSGPRGSLVNLRVRRDKKTLNLIAKRGAVRSKQKSITSKVLTLAGDSFGYIKMDRFFSGGGGVNGSKEEFKQQLLGLKSQSIKGLLIDLRDNGGGVLEEVIDIAGYFIPSGPIVLELGTENEGFVAYQDKDNETLFDKPVVILVNEGSASASEILAGSLKFYNRALIVGSEHTYGKGTIQVIGNVGTVLEVPQWGGGLRLTVGYYFLPDGESVQFDGVQSHLVLNQKHADMKLEKDLPNSLKPPSKFDFGYKNVGKWIKDTEFKKAVRFVQDNVFAINNQAEEQSSEKELNAALTALKTFSDYVTPVKAADLAGR